jgi:hypothetical protein
VVDVVLDVDVATGAVVVVIGTAVDEPYGGCLVADEAILVEDGTVEGTRDVAGEVEETAGAAHADSRMSSIDPANVLMPSPTAGEWARSS